MNVHVHVHRQQFLKICFVCVVCLSIQFQFQIPNSNSNSNANSNPNFVFVLTLFCFLFLQALVNTNQSSSRRAQQSLSASSPQKLRSKFCRTGRLPYQDQGSTTTWCRESAVNWTRLRATCVYPTSTQVCLTGTWKRRKRRRESWRRRNAGGLQGGARREVAPVRRLLRTQTARRARQIRRRPEQQRRARARARARTTSKGWVQLGSVVLAGSSKTRILNSKTHSFCVNSKSWDTSRNLVLLLFKFQTFCTVFYVPEWVDFVFVFVFAQHACTDMCGHNFEMRYSGVAIQNCSLSVHVPWTPMQQVALCKKVP